MPHRDIFSRLAFERVQLVGRVDQDRGGQRDHPARPGLPPLHHPLAPPQQQHSSRYLEAAALVFELLISGLY